MKPDYLHNNDGGRIWRVKKGFILEIDGRNAQLQTCLLIELDGRVTDMSGRGESVIQSDITIAHLFLTAAGVRNEVGELRAVPSY